MNAEPDAPAARTSTMATSMPPAGVDVSDVTRLGLAAMAALAGRDASPRRSSHGSPAHSRSHSHSYPQSQPESYYHAPHQQQQPQHQQQQQQPQHQHHYQQHQQQQHQHQQQNQHQQQQPPSSRASPLSRSRDVVEDTINASGVFPPPPFASDRPTSASHDHHQQYYPHQHQQHEQRPSSSSSSAARNAPKLAAARRPLPSAVPSASAPGSNASSKPPSRRPSASSASPILSAAYKERMDEADTNGRDATSAAKSGRDTVEPNGSANALEDEIVVGSISTLRASPAIILSDREDTAMGDARNDSPAPTQPKRKRSTPVSEVDEDKAEHNLNNRAAWTPVPRARPPKTAQQAHHAGSNGASSNLSSTPVVTGVTSVNKIDIPLGYWRDSDVPDVKDRHAIVGFIDTLERLRTRVLQFTRAGKPISPDFHFPSGTGSSWVTFEHVVFENHLIGLDHNQIKEYVKIRTEAYGVPETPEEKLVNEKAAVKEAMRRASAHSTSDSQPPPQIAYGVDLPDFAVFPNRNRPDKKRRVTNGLGAALSPETDPIPTRSAPPATVNNGELVSIRSPSVVSAIQRSAIDLLPGTRPAKILVGYWRGSSEERIDDKHAVLGILGANDMFRVKVTRQTRDGRPVLGNFPVGAGALWINYDEVEFEQHIRHLSRPEMKEYVRVRQRQLDEGEKPDLRQSNESIAVYEAQSRVLKAGGAAQSTLGNAGRVDTISFATAARLDREAARVAEMNDVSSKNHENGERNGMPYEAAPQDGMQRRGSSGHEFRQTRRSTGDAPEDAASIAAAAVAAAAASSTAAATATGRPAGHHSLSEASSTPADGRRGDAVSSHNAERVERTNSIARREITRMESQQQRNEQRAGISNANGNSSTPVVPSQPANGSVSGANGTNGVNGTNGANGANGANGGNSNRQTFHENIGRLNKVWASQEASRLRADGEDAKIFRGVKYERKQTGPFQGKLVSPGTILSIDGEDYVEYRVLTKPTFF